MNSHHNEHGTGGGEVKDYLLFKNTRVNKFGEKVNIEIIVHFKYSSVSRLLQYQASRLPSVEEYQMIEEIICRICMKYGITPYHIAYMGVDDGLNIPTGLLKIFQQARAEATFILNSKIPYEFLTRYRRVKASTFFSQN